MNEEAYKKRLSTDLDRWVAAGLLDASKRDALLATLPVNSERAAASMLAWAGSILAGLAVIAFMAANWDVFPRIVRLGAVLALFWGALSGALWATSRAKPKVREAFMLFAVLVFAAGIGLVGQMYNFAGDPRNVLLAAGLAGLALGAAGRSGPAAGAGMVMVGIWYVSNGIDNPAFDAGDLVAAMALGSGAWLAATLRSRLLLHLTIIGVFVLSAVWLGKFVTLMGWDAETTWRLVALAFAALWGFIAYRGRVRFLVPKPGGATIYTYGVWFALVAFPFVGAGLSADDGAMRILHRIVWLALSLLAMALGSKDNQRGVLAAGVLSLVITIGVILSDLQLNLLTATAVFGVAAAAALGLAWKLSKDRKADA